MRRIFFFCLLFFSCEPAFSQSPPSWLSPPSLPSSSSQVVPVPPVRVVERVKVRTDTVSVKVTDTVYVARTDTVRDTVSLLPAEYRYVIRYAICGVNVSTKTLDWQDYSSVAEIVARDEATLRVGDESLREVGSIIDNFGNKIPQQQVITTGFTIQIDGVKSVIEYRGKNSVAFFSGSFDSSGYMIATAEIDDSGFLVKFFPFNFFFGTGKRKIIIEIVREKIAMEVRAL